jgi:hypothetical protein
MFPQKRHRRRFVVREDRFPMQRRVLLRVVQNLRAQSQRPVEIGMGLRQNKTGEHKPCAPAQQLPGGPPRQAMLRLARIPQGNPER